MNKTQVINAKRVKRNNYGKSYKKKSYTYKPKRNFNKKGLFPGVPRDVGQYLGSLLPLPGSMGEKIGGSLGNFIGKITGLGSYNIKQNSLYNVSQDPPKVINGVSGIRVQHREYIQDVLSSIGFENQIQLPIQPGVSTFPWLSQIATRFQQYKLHGIIFEFISSCGSAIASTNNALGNLMMATNYNSSEGVYSNKQQFTNSEFSIISVPSQNATHYIECAANQSTIDHLYIRSGAITNGDIKMYDLGIFQLAVQGMQANDINIGSLYISYDIEFFKPVMISNSIFDMSAHYRLTGQSASYPLGTGRTNVQDDYNISFSAGGSGTQTITIPANQLAVGRHILTYYCYGTSSTTVQFGVPVLTNATGNYIFNNGVGFYYGNNNTSTPVLFQQISFVVTSSLVDIVVSISGVTIPGGSITGDLFLTKVDDTMNA